MDEKQSVATQMVSLLESSSSEDLTELDQQIGRRESELNSMKMLRRLVAARVNGEDSPTNKKPGPKPKEKAEPASAPSGPGTLMDQRRRQVVKFLATTGATPVMRIAKSCSIPDGSIVAVLDHEWFVKTAEGVLITPAARRDLL